MPSNKSKKEISAHIFFKYKKYRSDHNDESDYIQSDLKEVVNADYVYVTLLTKCDLHHTTLYKILNSFRSDPAYSFSEIVKNPFKFVTIPDNVLSFEKAKSICDNFRLQIDAKEVYAAWLYDHILFRNNQFFLHKNTLCKQFYKAFPDAELDVFEKLIVDYPAVSVNHCSVEPLVAIENKMTEYMRNLFAQPKGNNVVESVAARIASYESKHGIHFTKKQRAAIRNAAENSFSIICGLPGTGKSTIADCICAFHEKVLICLAAPTGIASNNIRNKCTSVLSENIIFGTMHKLLLDIFIELKTYPGLIIIDEFSMVDSVLFYRILQWCDVFKCKLVLLADIQQLPPISAGNPLFDLLESKTFPCVRLTQIKRQNKGKLKEVVLKLSADTLDPIIQDDIDKKSVFLFNYSENNVRNLIKTHHLTPQNCQFISPQHKHEEGTIRMNNLLQSIYNPKGNKIYSYHTDMSPNLNVIRHNDVVVRNVNDYTDKEMYANGDIGVVRKKSETNLVEVHYTHTKQVQKVLPTMLYEEFSLAYCMTVHKVQGSQFENVVIIINDNHHFSWTNDNAKHLLYTAISRATDKCFIMGNPRLLAAAQRTLLKKKLSVFMKHFD